MTRTTSTDDRSRTMNRRTPEQIAADNLAAAQAKADAAADRITRCEAALRKARAAHVQAVTARDYAAAHPLLQEPTFDVVAEA